LSAGTRRSGSSKFGLFNRSGHDGQHGQHGPLREAGGPAESYTGRHAGPRRTTARKKRVGKVVPVAAVAATIAAGAAAYGLVGGGGPQAAQLADSAQAPSSLSGTAHASLGSAGGAESAASATVRAAQAATGSVTHASARPRGSASPKVSAKPSATHANATPAKAATPAAAASTHASTPTASPSASATHTASTLSCNLSYSMLPDNVTAIVSFLLAHGYTDNAAAGIAGNMYQESKGNPESEGMGGGGLIGFTPLPGGYVTGNAEADLQTQLSAVLTYNQQWASYLPALDDAATPADAASIYVTDFERAGIPAASTREASAQEVAEACGI
jgi:hypothetical protein